MKDVFVMTKNVAGFTNAVEAAGQEKGPKIILVKGRPGLGKTRTCAWFAAQNDAVYLEAEAGWNIGWFLDDLCFELGITPEHKLSNRSRQIKDLVRKEKPVLIIDEADLLKHDRKVLETIKSIHDRCDVPVVLIGTGEIDQMIKSYAQFRSRVFEKVEFGEIAKDELHSVISQVSEIDFPAAVVDELSKYVKTMRDVVRYVPHIERSVRGRQVKKADKETIIAVAKRMPGERVAA